MNRRSFVSMLSTLAASGLGFPMTALRAEETKNIAERLADYTYSLTYDDLDPATIEAVKTHLADALGCGVAALKQRPVEIAREVALADSGGNGTSTVMGTSARTSPALAAFANGAAIRYYDLNDVYAGKEIGHPSDNATACLAQGEAQKAHGRDVILAIAIAYEIDCRLMDGASASSRGWDHPIYSLPAAALASGKLMKLTPAQLTQAVNIAINGHIALNQTRVQTMSNWKGLADADATRNGVFAAELARGGITGPSPIFEGEAGLFKQVTGPFTVDTSAFGNKTQRFKIRDCAVKFYPAQVLTQTAIIAGIDVAKQVGDLSRITAIEIRTSQQGRFTAGLDKEKWAPASSETADHSLPYVTVRAMLDGDIGLNSYRQEALHDPKALALMKRTTVVADPELTKLFPKYYVTVVTATLDNGKTYSKRVDDVPGFATHPMTRADFEVKFHKNADDVIGAQQANAALALLWDFENLDDISKLFTPFVLPA
ncbi:MmgE/PrpD family protein [Paraburkholderia sp. ZP32-5]|uniref:MmgE/PrpD family protein n=1 Tax=Paraburkholderia sp. ZP32-5 TaxID=2883245 RepID=UPI003FA3768E